MVTSRLVSFGPLLLGALAGAVSAPLDAQSNAAPPPTVLTHDNTKAAGQLQNGVLRISLRAGRAQWQPEGQIAPARFIEAFGEDGAALTVPSPLIRVPVGTVVE